MKPKREVVGNTEQGLLEVIMIIYSITNKINGKKYIGQTIKDLNTRIQDHLACAKMHYHRKLYNAINKYGWENFEVKIECTCATLDELNKMETAYIIKYDTVVNGYNMGLGGDNNVMFSENVKHKHDAKMRTKEVRSKISASMKKLRQTNGFSQETRKKISEKLKGNKHFLGKTRTADAIHRTTLSLMRPVHCEDVNGNIVAQFPSVKSAATWLLSIGRTKCTTVKTVCGSIKKSDVNSQYVDGLLWVYDKSCVETTKTIKNLDRE